MRIFLVALLLTGCSMADIKGNYESNIDEQINNKKIYYAEQECAGNGLAFGTREYDKCVNDELQDDPKVLAHFNRLKSEYTQRVANGTEEDHRRCESFGYHKGTSAYDICLEYARDNKPVKVAQTKTRI